PLSKRPDQRADTPPPGPGDRAPDNESVPARWDSPSNDAPPDSLRCGCGPVGLLGRSARTKVSVPTRLVGVAVASWLTPAATERPLPTPGESGVRLAAAGPGA